MAPENEEVDDSKSMIPAAHSEDETADISMCKCGCASEEPRETADSSASSPLVAEGPLKVVPLRCVAPVTNAKTPNLGVEWVPTTNINADSSASRNEVDEFEKEDHRVGDETYSQPFMRSIMEMGRGFVQLESERDQLQAERDDAQRRADDLEKKLKALEEESHVALDQVKAKAWEREEKRHTAAMECEEKLKNRLHALAEALSGDIFCSSLFSFLLNPCES